jgi:hypothetical protein
MTTAVQNTRTNAAEMMLSILKALRNSPPKATVARALSDAMPFKNEPEGASLDRLNASMRIATAISVLRELTETIEHANVARGPARKCVEAGLTMFSDLPARLQESTSWMHRISDETISLFEVLAHGLPPDRNNVLGTQRTELITALSALRALAAAPETDPAVRAELNQIIAILDEAIVTSYLRGGEAVADVMLRWQRRHKEWARQMSKNGGANSAQVASTYAAVVKAARDIADDALRANGLIDLATDAFAALTHTV